MELPFTTEGTVKRYSKSNDVDVLETSHSVEMFIQPQDMEITVADDSFAQTFSAYADSATNIQGEDILEVTYKEKILKYRVASVNDFSYSLSGIDHLEVVLERI